MIFYKSGYKYQLYKDRIHYIPCLEKYHVETKYFIIDDGTLVIKAGYAWDGASGPTWDTKSTKRASLVHDVLYQCIAYDLLPQSIRLESDKILFDIMIEAGAWKWRAKLWLKTLKWFGRPEQKKVEVAP